jgi:hypothetical protein
MDHRGFPCHEDYNNHLLFSRRLEIREAALDGLVGVAADY